MADETPNAPPNPRGRRKNDRKLPSRPGTSQTIWLALGFLLMLALGQAVFFSMQSGETIAYSDFKAAVRAGKVQEVAVADDRVRGVLKAEGQTKARPFTAVRIEDPKLVEEL